jgi:hypothetical protein
MRYFGRIRGGKLGGFLAGLGFIFRPSRNAVSTRSEAA